MVALGQLYYKKSVSHKLKRLKYLTCKIANFIGKIYSGRYRLNGNVFDNFSFPSMLQKNDQNVSKGIQIDVISELFLGPSY